MIVFWLIVGVLFLILLFGYIAYYFRTQPQLKPELGRESGRESGLDFGQESGRELGLGRELSRNTLIVMARNPHWLFAYWDLPNGLGENQHIPLMLRVYKLTETSQFDFKHTSHFDIELSPGAESWHIKGLEAHTTYVLEIGQILEDGFFRALARSRRVTTPADSPGEIDPHWIPEDELWQSTHIQLGKASEYNAERND